MNSYIIQAKVMHDRRSPRKNRFSYGIFTFALDLDELQTLDEKLRLFGVERRSLFRFSAKDHLGFGKTKVKENILEYLKQNGVSETIQKAILITNVRILGYVFNPVSFYYFYGENDEPLCAVAEVGNTFGEQKPFFLGKETWKDGAFRLKTGKFFYVSPFVGLKSEFEFTLRPSKEGLNIRIDVLEEDKAVMVTTYSGTKLELSDINLLRMFLRYPLVTVKVIVLIHWQALRLYLKGLPFIKKEENTDLQKGVHLGKNH
ncbi:DUF1365 domain-containing protein [Leptospira sp. 201903071]|uniref:DUF1365 domain-containing protein n=1 Tax=Leptospira ainazelensis TaxID=2810034 RepID=UPI001963A9CF|nr:DUF1365 domain-containing protein [Leptospira ainazelensis]MBM9499770.1 DUF1365 domain-containing protein [Leptospira ainazelensis]